MAQKTVSNLQDSVRGQLQGMNLKNVTNLFTVFERVARQVTQLLDIPDTEGRQTVILYDGVTDYVSPTDIFGSTLLDLQPQGTTRSITDYVYKLPISTFDRTKGWLQNGTQIEFEFVKGVGRMRIKSVRPMPKIELDAMTETTGWTLGGTASGLTKDQTVLYQNPASLRFTLTGAGTGTLTKTIPQVDLTDYVGVGVVFLAFRTPSAANLTSFSIKLGSTAGLATNYYQVASVTTGFLGAWTAGDWLLVALDLATATTVGTPVPTAIKYVEVDIVSAGTLTNFYVGDLWIALPSPHTLIYTSTAFFSSVATGIPSQSITSISDTIILNDAAYVIYELMCAVAVAEQQGGTLASGVLATINERLNGKRGYRGILIQSGLIDIYRSENPSQKLPTLMNWYD